MCLLFHTVSEIQTLNTVTLLSLKPILREGFHVFKLQRHPPPPQLENVAVKIYEADQDQDQDI